MYAYHQSCHLDHLVGPLGPPGQPCTTSTTLTDQTTLTILADQWLIKKIITESALFTWSCSNIFLKICKFVTLCFHQSKYNGWPELSFQLHQGRGGRMAQYLFLQTAADTGPISCNEKKNINRTVLLVGLKWFRIQLGLYIRKPGEKSLTDSNSKVVEHIK